MADDPRIEPAACDERCERRNGNGYCFCAARAETEANRRLRALLADEDRAVDLIERAMMAGHGTPTTAAGTFSSAESRAVLAALREVAGLVDARRPISCVPVGDLITPAEGAVEPEPPTRPGSLRGKAIPAREVANGG